MQNALCARQTTISSTCCRGLPGRQAALLQATPRPVRRRTPTAAASEGDAASTAVGGWIDLASFVTSAGGKSAHTPFDDLADRIGRDVYLDVAGWHLHLKDVRLSQAAGSASPLSLAQGLAAQLGPQLQQSGRGMDSAALMAVLKKVPVKLGGGKLTVPLADLLPSGCLRELEDICERWARS